MSSEKIRILKDKKRRLEKIKDGWEKTKNTWEERKIAYEKEQAITNNPGNKFEAGEGIKRCDAEIQKCQKEILVCQKQIEDIDRQIQEIIDNSENSFKIGGVGTPQTQLKYAGFYRRMTADSLDISILLMASIIVDLIVYGLPDQPEEFFRVFFLYILLGFLYYPVMESSIKQATFGKMAVGIFLTDLQGKKISFEKAIIRHGSKFISFLLVGLGLFPIWGNGKQTLHDKISGCIVNKYPRESARANASIPARFIASIIDAIIMYIVFWIITGKPYLEIIYSPNNDWKSVVYSFLFLIILWLYFASMESSPIQATIGKCLLGIKVVDNRGKLISFKRATSRYLGKFLFCLIIIFGFIALAIVDTTNTSGSGHIVVVFLIFLQGFLVLISDNLIAVLSREKQTVHDIIARCLVIKGK